MVSQTNNKPTMLITGCSGLIGERLMKVLSENYSVIGLDVQEPDHLPADATYVECDLTDDASVGRCIENCAERAGETIASVVHLAAYYDFSGEPSPMYEKLTVEGTRRLLRALQPYDVEQFIFASSLLVMKSAADDDRKINENSPVEAEWDYPQSKVAAEEVISSERGKIPAVILRVAGVFDEDCNSLPISQQIKRIREKQLESHFFPGDASHGQPFVHLDDLMACFVNTIERRGQLDPREMFLICEDGLMSYEELQNDIGQYLHGDEWSTMRIPKFMAKAGAWAKEQMSSDDDQPFIKPWMVDLADQHYPVDISLARQRLGWQPQHTLRGTLPTIIKRMQKDPQAWYKKNGLPLPKELHEQR